MRRYVRVRWSIVAVMAIDLWDLELVCGRKLSTKVVVKISIRFSVTLCRLHMALHKSHSFESWYPESAESRCESGKAQEKKKSERARVSFRLRSAASGPLRVSSGPSGVCIYLSSLQSPGLFSQKITTRELSAQLRIVQEVKRSTLTSKLAMYSGKSMVLYYYCTPWLDPQKERGILHEYYKRIPASRGNSRNRC